MRPKEPPRVMGPYEERDKWRIVVVENGKRKSVFLDTEAEALRAKSELERKVLRPVSKKLCDVINLWEQELLRSGTTKALSVTHKAVWARTLLKSMLEEEISSVTPRRAAAMYEEMLSDRFCDDSRSCWRSRTRALNQRNYTPQSLRNRSVSLK